MNVEWLLSFAVPDGVTFERAGVVAAFEGAIPYSLAAHGAASSSAVQAAVARGLGQYVAVSAIARQGRIPGAVEDRGATAVIAVELAIADDVAREMAALSGAASFAVADSRTVAGSAGVTGSLGRTDVTAERNEHHEPGHDEGMLCACHGVPPAGKHSMSVGQTNAIFSGTLMSSLDGKEATEISPLTRREHEPAQQ
jgi:hypothetical protein